MTSTYELVLESLLAESKTDTYARRITQRVIAAVKRKMGEMSVESKPTVKMVMMVNWPSFIKRQDFFSTPMGRLQRAIASGGQFAAQGPMTMRLNLEVTVVPAKKDGVNVGGAWSNTHDTLKIEVMVGSTTGKIEPQHLNKIQYRTYEVTRHELEHATQSDDKVLPAVIANKELNSVGPGGKPQRKTPQMIANYFLADAEVEAFVAGFYHQAKRTRRPFIDLIDEKIRGFIDFFTKRGMDPITATTIFTTVKKKWLEYAKQRFSNAVVQKPVTK